MLRACRRALKPGGWLAFYTIHMSPGLNTTDRRRAARLGPPAVASNKREHSTLLTSAGFVAVSETDRTDHFLQIAREWGRARERHAAELRDFLGQDEFAKRQTNNRNGIKAIEAGLIRRSLVVARRPS